MAQKKLREIRERAIKDFGVIEVLVLHRYGAVSYTHLRAHETVLDLVCRLLLEKKNKTHQYYHHLCYIHIVNPTSDTPISTPFMVIHS